MTGVRRDEATAPRRRGPARRQLAAGATCAFLPAIPLLATGGQQAGAANATARILPGALTMTSTAAPDRHRAGRIDLTIRVIDARGDGRGWSVVLSPHGASAAPKGTRITRSGERCAGGATCTLATPSLRYPLALPAGARARRLVNAAHGTGMGAQVIHLSLELPTAGARTPAALARTLRVKLVVRPHP